MLLLLYFVALVACQALAAPANSSQLPTPVDPTQNATNTNISSSSQLTPSSNSLNTTPIVSSASTSLTNPTNTTLSQVLLSPSTLPPPYSSMPLSLSLSSALATFTSIPASTVFVTEVVTTFETITVDATPTPTSTVTVVVTEITTATATETPATIPSPSWEIRTLWAAPPRMTDLSAFNITYFPSGQRNLHIVSEIPPEAFPPMDRFLPSAFFPSSTLLRLVYPAHSVNPSSKPAGGADFYATPLNLTGARNVTLAYSVFFPADFDWVKGGKLPGLFGGHTGCSGGASARDCFSTRLMWRPQGVGELYLYAPKDKQSDALCADAASVCDAAYGFSIGRGAFRFTAGGWTHVVQTVVLNTPGNNDGAFTLAVDGRMVIERGDMFYRDVVPAASEDALRASRGSAATAAAIAFGPPTGATGHESADELDEDDGPRPAEFLGLFFSTFFGGHGKQYATPKEQYTWFKDFAIARYD